MRNFLVNTAPLQILLLSLVRTLWGSRLVLRRGLQKEISLDSRLLMFDTYGITMAYGGFQESSVSTSGFTLL